MKHLLLILILSVFFATDKSVSMLGLKINDPEASLQNINLQVVSKDKGVTKYRTANGNDLSVTCADGRIVYMENDWLHDANGPEPLFSDFKFGQTTLRDIRKKFGTNGFKYVNRAPYTTKTDVVEFNCFEFNTKSNEILVLITKTPLKLAGSLNGDNIADNLKLEAIIIADKGYIESLWGVEKIYDKIYRKIKP